MPWNYIAPDDSTKMQFSIISDHDAMIALEADWNALWERSESRRFTNTFTWRALGWRTTGLPRGREMRILVGRVGDETALIWPLLVRKRLLFWRTASTFGPEYTDYHPLLVSPGPAAATHVQHAWEYLRENLDADVVTAAFVDRACVLHDVLSAEKRFGRSETLPSPKLRWGETRSWDQYWRSLSRNRRSQLTRRMRRLTDLGAVTFERVEEGDEYREVVDWTITQKLEWMKRCGLNNNYLATKEFRAFLLALGENNMQQGRWLVFALKVNGKLVATKLGAINEHCSENFISAYDAALSKLAPGSLIFVKTLEWLCDCGLDYDFRFGEESYKEQWASEDHPVTTFDTALTPMGVLLLTNLRVAELARLTKDRVRLMVPSQIRHAVKAWINRAPAASPHHQDDPVFQAAM